MHTLEICESGHLSGISTNTKHLKNCGEMTMQEKVPMPMGFSQSGKELPREGGIEYGKILRRLADWRNSRRYEVKRPLLAVCDFYSGEIFDISRCGFSFRIAHIRNEEGSLLRAVKPSPSRTVNIFSPGSFRHLLKDLEIDKVFDLLIGPLYTDNGKILQYRRGVRLAAPLTDYQMQVVQPYLENDPMDSAV